LPRENLEQEKNTEKYKINMKNIETIKKN